MWNQTKILKEKRSLSTIQTGEIKITNHWRERIKVQHKPVEVSFLACITVLSVFFLFASLLCPHLQQEAAASTTEPISSVVELRHLENRLIVGFWSTPAALQQHATATNNYIINNNNTACQLGSWGTTSSQTCHKFICLVKVRYWILGSECGLCAIVRKKEGVLV